MFVVNTVGQFAQHSADVYVSLQIHVIKLTLRQSQQR